MVIISAAAFDRFQLFGFHHLAKLHSLQQEGEDIYLRSSVSSWRLCRK